MRFSPVRPIKAASQVADALRDAILTGGIGVGDALPSERDLARDFSVNRSTVREALHRLEAWGLVEIRHGDTTRARDVLASAGLQVLPALLAPAGQLDVRLLRDLLEIRAMLLGWTAGKAARSDAPRERLRGLVVALEAARDPAELQRLDFDFFAELVAMADNRVLTLVAGAVRTVYREHGALFAALYAAPVDLTFHRATLAAIEAKDPAAATAAMTAWGEAALRMAGA